MKIRIKQTTELEEQKKLKRYVEIDHSATTQHMLHISKYHNHDIDSLKLYDELEGSKSDLSSLTSKIQRLDTLFIARSLSTNFDFRIDRIWQLQ